MENKNILYGALAAFGIGGALYFLSLDGDSSSLQYNKKVHSLDSLIPFAQEMDLDFRCFYVRVYNLILRMKDSNQFNQRMMSDLQGQLNIELEDKASGNIKAYNLNIFKEMMRNAGIDADKKKEFLIKYNKATLAKNDKPMMEVFGELSGKKDDKLYKEWFNQNLSTEVYKEFLVSNRSDARLIAIKDGIATLHHQVFEDVLVKPNAKFAKLLEDVALTRETYIRIQRKIWATLRHDLYVSIQKWKNTEKQLNCPEKTVEELWTSEFTNFEPVRQEIFKLITGHDVDMREAKQYMLMAYLEFSAVSTTTKFDAKGNVEGTPARSLWPDLVNETAKKHNDYIVQMKKGQYYANIEKDPRQNSGPDEKIDLGVDMKDDENNNKDSVYNRQKSKMIDEMATKTNITPEANKVVNKLLQRARDVKDKNAKEAKERDDAIAAATPTATPTDTPATPTEKQVTVEVEAAAAALAQPVEKKVEEPVKVDSQYSAGVNTGESQTLPSLESVSVDEQPVVKVDVKVEDFVKAEVVEAPKSPAPEVVKVAEAPKSPAPEVVKVEAPKSPAPEVVKVEDIVKAEVV